VGHISRKQSIRRNLAATAQPSSCAGSKFPQESVRQCCCSLGLGGTAEMGIDISLHSSDWNKTESSEKNKHLAESMTGDKPGERETLIMKTAKNEG